MNEQRGKDMVRGSNLVTASRSMSVAPQTTLTTARDIRRALERNIGGGNYGVYCSLVNDRKLRVSGVRTWHGTLQVKCLNSGFWVEPEQVWVEG